MERTPTTASRRERDHRYAVSEKGRARHRRYDTSYKGRLTRNIWRGERRAIALEDQYRSLLAELAESAPELAALLGRL